MSSSKLAWPKKIEYPESDGKPMADNTLQFRWIATLQGGLDDLFRDRSDVFVAGDLLWYPVEHHRKIRQAPDTMVVFGRPKGHRGSYMQWEEENLPPQVVFEVLSPGNRPKEMSRKLQFYERHGVEEYYLYDPDNPKLVGYVRDGNGFVEIDRLDGWKSPLLGITFDMSGEELRVRRPDGRYFLTYLELAEKEKREAERAEKEAQRAERESQRAQQAEADLNEEKARTARLMEQLRAAGIEPMG